MGGILAPDPGIEPGPPAQEGSLNHQPPRNSQPLLFNGSSLFLVIQRKGFWASNECVAMHVSYSRDGEELRSH